MREMVYSTIRTSSLKFVLHAIFLVACDDVNFNGFGRKGNCVQSLDFLYIHTLIDATIDDTKPCYIFYSTLY